MLADFFIAGIEPSFSSDQMSQGISYVKSMVHLFPSLVSRLFGFGHVPTTAMGLADQRVAHGMQTA